MGRIEGNEEEEGVGLRGKNINLKILKMERSGDSMKWFGVLIYSFKK